MRVTVRACRFAEIEAHPDFAALIAEYAAECAIVGLPAPGEKLAAYRLLAESGCFDCYGAFQDEALLGFVAVLSPVMPHYGTAITVSESLFVAKAHRHSGAGLKLLQAAEHHARYAGSPGLLVSAPSGGSLADLLPRLDYRETNRVFFKEIGTGEIARD